MLDCLGALYCCSAVDNGWSACIALLLQSMNEYESWNVGRWTASLLFVAAVLDCICKSVAGIAAAMLGCFDLRCCCNLGMCVVALLVRNVGLQQQWVLRNVNWASRLEILRTRYFFVCYHQL